MLVYGMHLSYSSRSDAGTDKEKFICLPENIVNVCVYVFLLPNIFSRCGKPSPPSPQLPPLLLTTKVGLDARATNSIMCFILNANDYCLRESVNGGTRYKERSLLGVIEIEFEN